MSKTFLYVLGVLAVWLLVISPVKLMNGATEPKTETKEKTEAQHGEKVGTGVTNKEDKNGVSTGASGRMKYQMGAKEYTN